MTEEEKKARQREISRNWRLANPEKSRESSRRWQKNNPDKVKERERRRVREYDPEKRSKWYRERADRDPEFKIKSNERNARRLAEVRQFIADFKLAAGCKDCGYKRHHAALDFDHVRGEKRINVCNARSISAALKEIEKCEVVCANCHRIRTYVRLKGEAPENS